MNTARTFKKAYPELYRRVYRYAAMRVWALEEAEDVTSETLIAAWKNIANYDASKAEFSTWVMAIARHKITDAWRKHQHTAWDDNALETLHDPRQELTAQHIDNDFAFQNIISSLPQHLRMLLALRHIDGLTHEEIAEVVHKSPAAVRQALSRLHKKLQQQFPEYGIEN